MSPRRYFHAFTNMPIPEYDKDLGPNLWFAFTAISGISDLFTYTPKEMNNNPVKDSQSGTEEDTHTSNP
jgi:hypothetical protein